MQYPLQLKALNASVSPEDGTRVFTDRDWPRGVSKDSARLDVWLKELAPSTTLKQWFNDETQRWESFQQKYLAELSSNASLLEEIRQYWRRGPVTLLYVAKDRAYCHTALLHQFLLSEPLEKRSQEAVEQAGD